MKNLFEKIQREGLYDPSFEHDNCGIGAIIDVEGRKSHQLVDDALSIVETWSIGPERMRRGKPATGSGS